MMVSFKTKKTNNTKLRWELQANQRSGGISLQISEGDFKSQITSWSQQPGMG